MLTLPRGWDSYTYSPQGLGFLSSPSTGGLGFWDSRKLASQNHFTPESRTFTPGIPEFYSGNPGVLLRNPGDSGVKSARTKA